MFLRVTFKAHILSAFVCSLAKNKIRPNWFKIENRKPAAVIADQYKDALDNVVVPYSQSTQNRRSIWYWKSGPRAHTTDILNHNQRNLDKSFISERSTIIWTLQSPNLNPGLLFLALH